jgi:hypothetical protein
VEANKYEPFLLLTLYRPNYLKHAETYNDNLTGRIRAFEQMKFEEEMREVTGSPRINLKSKNIKRNVNDLYTWKEKVSKKHEIVKEKKLSETENKLTRIMSMNLVDPNSELIASRTRQTGVRIEDKLLRDGLRMKHKQQKMLEDNFKASAMSSSPNRFSSKLAYKKILYPAPAPVDDLNFNLDKISKIPSRQYVISKLFKSQNRY